ncbi:class I SAM-dependent methyltransferase [Paenibacillus humicola]|uniref:class I SAM-dependent methyltransferase n=1 Tax=Paenibacillus humicola TaxID=3110540 RepID=UPI00237B54D1|nr:class I SAM-dependent methyltransferase [Paenibacillus humicola]
MLHDRFAEIEQMTASIQGWVSDKAGMRLYELARFHAPTGIVAELGSWKGRSTLWLAHGILDRGEGTVFAVDTWRGTETEPGHAELLVGYEENQLFEEFKDNLGKAGVLHLVHPIVGDTVQTARNFQPDLPIGLLFIDACHDYEAVKADFEHWSPLVADNGYIVFDDVPAWPGPTRLVFELPPGYMIRSIWESNCVVKKMHPSDITIADRLRHLMQLSILDREHFIRLFYLEALNREPAEQEKAAGLQTLAGAELTEWIARMLTSPEVFGG